MVACETVSAPGSSLSNTAVGLDWYTTFHLIISY